MTVSISYFGPRGDSKDDVDLDTAVGIVKRAIENGRMVIRIGRGGKMKFLKKHTEVTKTTKKLQITEAIRGG